MGWSEPTATNAPVEGEPVQPVLRMNILPARRDFFFHLLSAPKFSTSPLLPTTYQPHPPLLPTPSYLPPTNPTPPSYLHPPTYQLPTPPPSLHCQSSRDLERLWSRSWSYGYGTGARAVGARAGLAGVGAGPTCPRKGKMLTFFFVFLFFLFEEGLRSFLLPLSLLHYSLAKKKAFFLFFFLCCTAAQL
jgi:hypothetical protein